MAYRVYIFSLFLIANLLFISLFPQNIERKNSNLNKISINDIKNKKNILKDIEKRHIIAKLFWFIKIKQYSLVWPLLKKLENNFSEAAETNYFKAWHYYHKRQYLYSLIENKKAIKKKVEYAPAWNLEGVLLSLMDREKEALLAYKMAVKFNSYHPDYQYNLAYSLYKNKKWQEALKRIKKTIYLKPNSGKAFYLEALLYAKEAKFFQSIASFTIAEDFGISGEQFYLDFTSVVAQVNLEDELLRLIKILSKSKSKEIQYLRKLANLWNYLGEAKKSVAIYKLIVQDPKTTHSDRKRFVYFLEKQKIDSFPYIKKINNISKKEKKLLEIYAHSCRNYQRQQSMLKSIDPILD